jgi:WD40 repeat protein
MFTHDGKMLITAGGIGVVRFWDAATGAANGRSVLANSGWVDSLALTPDDSVLMTAGTDGTVRMIDTAGRHQLGSPLPGGDSDSYAALGPDGRVFVIYEPDGHGYVWDISLPSLVADACSVAGRPLTQVEWDQYVPGRPYAPACDAASSRTPGTSSASSTP